MAQSPPSARGRRAFARMGWKVAILPALKTLCRGVVKWVRVRRSWVWSPSCAQRHLCTGTC